MYFKIMISGIYKIENLINHHLYIGKAKDIKHRWAEHKSEANLNQINNHLYNALRKYGIENFDFSIIEEIPLEQYANISSEREKYWIKYYNAYLNPNNYNETEGGEGTCGWNPSQEWRNKMSQIKKEWYQTPEGKTKAKRQSEKMKGHTINKGISHTEEWKKQHSEQVSGENNGNYGTHTGGKKCLCIELNKIFESTREAATFFGCDHTCIAAACRGAQKTSQGYHWEYI